MLTVGTAVNYAAKGGVANTALVPTDLDKGSVGIYGLQEGDSRETLIVSGTTATGKTGDGDFKGKTIKICEGLGGGKFKTSEYLDIKGISLVSASAYVAPVAWRGYIGYNGTDGQTVIGTLKATNNIASLEIREIFSNREEGQPYFYDVQVDATGETQATILNKLKAAIDADPNSQWATLVSTSGGNSGLRLTANDASKSYFMSMRGVIETSPIRYIDVNLGSGTYERLRRFEIESQAKKGNLYTLDREYKEVPSSLVEGTTYDVYMLGGVNTHVPGGYGGAGLAGNPTVGTSIDIQVVFAQPQASTAGLNQIEFETIIKQLTGATFTSIVEAP